MTDFFARYTYVANIARILTLAGVLFIIYAVWKAPDTGDNLWLWLPLFLFIPIIGIPAYIIYRLKVGSDDRRWEHEQLTAERHRGGYVSRRVKSEKELREQYYRGKGRRN